MVTITVDDKNFQKGLKEAIAAVDDLTIPFTLITQSWFKSNRAIFALRGPGKYEDLSEAYKVFKREKWGFVYPILLASGRLRESLTVPGSYESIARIVNKTALFLGTSTPYAGYHQHGTSRMPKRPPVLTGAEQVAPDGINKRVSAWTSTIADYVYKVSNKKITGAST